MLNDMILVSAKNHSQPVHWHENFEINLVLAGEMDVMCNEHVYKVGAGELMVLNSSDAHSIKRQSDDLLYIQLQMNLLDFNYYIPHVSEARFYCTPEGDDPLSVGLKEVLKKYIANIVRYAEHPESTMDPDRKMVFCCIEILGGLKYFFSMPENQRKEEVKKFDLDKAWKVLSYVQNHIYRNVTIEEVAEEVEISTDELEESIRYSMDGSFEEFIMAMRVAVSMRSLMQTDKSVVEIAKENGFLSINQYRIAFFEIYGRTPDEYRKRSIKLLQQKRRNGADSISYDETEKREEVMTLIKAHEDLAGETRTEYKEVTIDIGTFDNSEKEAEGLLKTEEVAFAEDSENSIWKHNMKNSLSDMVSPYLSPEKGMYAWKDGDAFKILLAKDKKADFTGVVLKISGLDPYATYVYCRKKTSDIPASLREIVFSENASDLNEDILYNIHEMACEYGEFSGEPHVHMVVPLKDEQLEKIIIQKVDMK